jgi:alkylation response protein AidB-like acyl-CoA dehydrogenase
MDFTLPPEDEAFRLEVRQWFKDNLPRPYQRNMELGFFPPNGKDRRAFHRLLFKKGWVAPHWPVEYGGTGWTPIQQHIFEEESTNADAPYAAWSSTRLVAPVVIEFGTEEQKKKYLPPILNGDVQWCQGFSEPNAGSDLASLKTTAKLEGDHYIVNGSKIWTSEAHHADWGFFLVRTNTEVKPQHGISFLLIDMKSPGITIRPIIMISGSHTVNQVFLDNVKVPADQIVGEVNKGWGYGKFLLGNERTASAFIYYSRRELELRALEYSVIRILTGERNKTDAFAVTSALKIRGSEIQQKVPELAADILGPRALRYFDSAVNPEMELAALMWPDYVPGRIHGALHSRAYTIYGGSMQVQKGIIAKAAFGL